jgi:hypothetical protein
MDAQERQDLSSPAGSAGEESQAQAAAEDAAGQAQEISRRKTDGLLLVETLADFSGEERLVTREVLLEAFLERARKACPLKKEDITDELASQPDPRFEGPDPESIAQGIERIKAMRDTQPGASPDPPVPGIRKTRRSLSRRELLIGLLHGEETQAPVEEAEHVSVAAEQADSLAERPELDPAYAESLLDDVMAANEDVAMLTAWNGTVYYHYKPLLSGLYARILATRDNPAVQVAETVRESSRDYPRPVPLEIFEYPPFALSPEALQGCLRSMDGDENFADIKFTQSEAGTVYLYSSRYLDDAYADFLAEYEDTGAIASP